MNELSKIFDYQGKKVRTVGEMFVAKDVCEILEIQNSRDALTRLDDDEKGVVLTDTLGGTQEMQAVNESGLYTLILGSRKPEAKMFKRWVTHEVIPSIRKHGLYATEELLNNPDLAIRAFTALKEERAKRLEAEKKNHILMHVNKVYTTTEIAKELGFKSANALNADLSNRKIQYKQNNTWVLYSSYSNKGYTDIKQEVLDNGKVVYHRKWTQLGREFLLGLYQKESA